MRQGATSLALSTLLVVTGCSVQSGGEQAPIYEGAGVVIDDAGSDGRTLTVDPSRVPIVDSCGEGQVIERTATGWVCADPASAAAETDPSVNDLGKAALSCGAGNIVSYDGTKWVCASVGPAVEAAGYPQASALTTLTTADLVNRIAALEALLDGLRNGVLFADTFTRATLDGPETPAGSRYVFDAMMTGTPTLVNGALQRDPTDTTTWNSIYMDASLALPSIPSPYARLRMLVNFEWDNATTDTTRVSIDLPTGSVSISASPTETRVTSGTGSDVYAATMLAKNTDYWVRVDFSYGILTAYAISTSSYDDPSPYLSGPNAAGRWGPYWLNRSADRNLSLSISDAYVPTAPNYPTHTKLKEISFEQFATAP